jgi:hypothetical protein
LFSGVSPKSVFLFKYFAMVVSEIRLYELLKVKLGNQEVEAFIDILESKVVKKFDDAKKLLATKRDLAENKAEIIKWMFIFWIGQLATFIAIAKFFFH